ncbi:TetR/AcrR family transcriptional regulator [Actinomycetospora sp. NBRC 106375]|uniref:TetR/AcrR family transcriptional regulator n=1 Tax=Actinomycetospora sp. NBRC 106375 TaxID=3032207 RepID=UPI0025535B6C|nr:TetR/AcrR family transcriptional regulator [Actinomycetospora sp. NBRC 106375]
MIEVAAHLFTERGYEATSMADLSRAAGIAKSSIYHHVPGKEALLRGALEPAIEGLFGILSESPAQDGAPVERLRHIVRRQVEVLTTELPYVTSLLRLRGNTETECWALERRKVFDRRIAALVREAMDAGEIVDDIDAALAARLLSGAVNSLIEWYRPDRATPAELVAVVERMAFEGLRENPA